MTGPVMLVALVQVLLVSMHSDSTDTCSLSVFSRLFTFVTSSDKTDLLLGVMTLVGLGSSDENSKLGFGWMHPS